MKEKHSEKVAASAAHCLSYLFKPEITLPDGWLTTTEHQWLQQQSSEKRRKEVQWGRTLLRMLSCQVSGQPPALVKISLPDTGPPKLEVAGLRWNCAISHRHDLIAVALHPVVPVGLDVERCDHRSNLAAYADLFPALQGFCHNESAFYHRWTALEASAKHRGRTLQQVLNESDAAISTQLHYKTLADYLLCIACESTQTIWTQIDHTKLVTDRSP